MHRRSPSEIDGIRAACAVVHQVQSAVEAAASPGVSTLSLDELAEATIRDRGGEPAFKGHHGFPASICASVNDEAVHGLPRTEPLEEGDLLCVDVGVQLDGWFGDGAFTIVLGHVDRRVRGLVNTTRAALESGVAAARPGNRLSDISHAIESAAAAGGVSVIREFGGHGIGRHLHEDPHLPNHGPPGRGPHLRAGHVLAIEPIFSLGQPGIVVDEDGWTARTRDGSFAAHFEHTVAVTEDGPSLLTLSPVISDTADSRPVRRQPPGRAEAPPEKAEGRG